MPAEIRRPCIPNVVENAAPPVMSWLTSDTKLFRKVMLFPPDRWTAPTPNVPAFRLMIPVTLLFSIVADVAVVLTNMPFGWFVIVTLLHEFWTFEIVLPPTV